jgi:hypothetical protein
VASSSVWRLATGCKVRGLNLGRNKKFSCPHTRPERPLGLTATCTYISRGKSGQSVAVISTSHPAPRLIMSRAMYVRPPVPLVANYGKTFSSNYGMFGSHKFLLEFYPVLYKCVHFIAKVLAQNENESYFSSWR